MKDIITFAGKDMKSILSVFIFIVSMFLICVPVSAQKTVGVFITAPDAIIKDADQTDKLEIRLAELLPKEKYNILPIRKMLTKEAEYRRRKNIFQSPNQVTEPKLTKEAICELGKEIGCDYVLSIRIDATEVKKKWDFSIGTNAVKRMNLITVLVITDIEKQTDIFQQQYKNRGVDKVYMFNTRSGNAGKAIINAFNKFLQEMVIVPGKDIP